MRFEWQKFCEARGIRFETSGPRVSKGNINIACPWCGAADKSGHMGLSLDPAKPFYGCLRNADHRGKNPVRLIAKLLHIPLFAAQALVDMEGPRLDDFDAAIARLRDQGDEAPTKARKVQLDRPREFRELAAGNYAPRFWDYLARQRGFGDDVDELVCDYELYYAMTGDQAWRLVFPIYSTPDLVDLVGWTGRSIRRGDKLRYLTSQDLPDDALLQFKVPAWYAHPVGLWLVCEGPLDALKLDYYGRQYGIGAIATMGTGRADAAKAAAIRRVAGPDAGVAVVLDADAMGQALGFAEELGGPVFFLPPDVQDPGALTPTQAKIFLGKVAETSLL